MHEPTVSIVVPNYNHAAFLTESLTGLLKQSQPPLEIIVIDDASTDDSTTIIQELARQHPHLRLERNAKNIGVVATMNRGLQLAQGDYVFFAAADDRTLPTIVEKSLALLAAHPQAGLCSALSNDMDEKGSPLGRSASAIVAGNPAWLPPADVLRLLHQHRSWFMANTVFYHRQALLEMGGFPGELRSFADGFMQQALALKQGACFIPEVLACFRVVAGQYSSAADRAETALPMYRRAVELMRGQHRNLFPESYVARFEQETLVYVLLRSWDSSQQSHASFLASLAPNPNLLARMLLGSARCTIRVQRFLVKLFILIAVRRDLLATIKRRVGRDRGKGIGG